MVQVTRRNIVEPTSKTQATEKEVKVPCEVYSRIVGYLRPVQNWNEGKKQEFEDRETFKVKARPED
ncbi:MAG: hypothetical protein JXB35_10330 [Anaerolineae bacterium]|nr:hypothetical protein [Anaerolineae bacterium]